MFVIYEKNLSISLNNCFVRKNINGSIGRVGPSVSPLNYNIETVVPTLKNARGLRAENERERKRRFTEQPVLVSDQPMCLVQNVKLLWTK